MTTLTQFQQSELKRFDEEFPCESEMCLTGCICGNKELKEFLNSSIEKAFALGKEEAVKEDYPIYYFNGQGKVTVIKSRRYGKLVSPKYITKYKKRLFPKIKNLLKKK